MHIPSWIMHWFLSFNDLICLIFGWMGYYCTITIPKGGIVESEKVGPGPDSALGFPRGVLCTPSTCHSGLDPLYVAWRELSLNQIYPLCLSFVRHYFPQNALQHLSMGYANILRSTFQYYVFFSQYLTYNMKGGVGDSWTRILRRRRTSWCVTCDRDWGFWVLGIMLWWWQADIPHFPIQKLMATNIDWFVFVIDISM